MKIIKIKDRTVLYDICMDKEIGVAMCRMCKKDNGKADQMD